MCSRGVESHRCLQSGQVEANAVIWVVEGRYDGSYTRAAVEGVEDRTTANGRGGKERRHV